MEEKDVLEKEINQQVQVTYIEEEEDVTATEFNLPLKNKLGSTVICLSFQSCSFFHIGTAVSQMSTTEDSFSYCYLLKVLLEVLASWHMMSKQFLINLYLSLRLN